MKGPRVALAKKVVASAVRACDRDVERHESRVERAKDRVEDARLREAETHADAKEARVERDTLAAAHAVLED